MDIEKLRRVLIGVALFFLAVWTGAKGSIGGNMILGLLLPILLIAVQLVQRPTALLVGIIIADGTRFIFPGLPSALGISQVLQIVLIGWAILDTALNKEKRRPAYQAGTDIWMVVFFLNIIFTMFYRGVGFRLLGEGEYGGSGYILLIISSLFYFSAVKLTIRESQIRTILWCALGGSLVPIVVQALIYVSRGEMLFLLHYVRTAGAGLVREAESEGGIERWTSFSMAATSLIPIAFLRLRKPWLKYFFLCVVLVLQSYTGFRSRIFLSVVLIGICAIYYSKNRPRAIVNYTVGGLILWVVLIAGVQALPRAAQRSLSAIPLVQGEYQVEIKAGRSTDWRVQMWKNYCIPNVPKYFWIGRGISQNIMEYAWLQTKWYHSEEFFYHMGGYHSGPFSLILDWGIIGTLSFTIFFWRVMMDSWRTLRRYAGAKETLAFRYFGYLTILLTTEIFNYYFIFGSVRSGLFRLLLMAALLRIVKKNVVGAFEELTPAVQGSTVNTYSPAMETAVPAMESGL